MEERLAEKLEALCRDWQISGEVCLTYQNEIVYNQVFGMADRENQIPFAFETNCYLASVTKQFTAVCIMLLYEQKAVKLNDTLAPYIPEYSHAAEITIRQLLNMTSGIVDYQNDLLMDRVIAEKSSTSLSERDFFVYRERFLAAPPQCAFADILQMVNDLPLKAVPGKDVQYCNTNYVFLSEIVARVSGMPIQEFMDKHIFQPLAMSHTVFGASRSEAASYLKFQGERLPLGRSTFASGDGAICSTAEDLSLWLRAILRKELLQKASWKQIFTMFKGEYGFGWRQIGPWYHHGGVDLGYRSYVLLNFEKQLSIAVVLNEEPEERSEEEEVTFIKKLRKVVYAYYSYPEKLRLARFCEANLRECLELKVSREQRQFVAPNTRSIAQAYADKKLARPFVLMDGKNSVGFVMFAIVKKQGIYYIWRFMIDRHYQGKGYGKAAMRLCLDYLKKAGAQRVILSVELENEVAQKLYRSYGFLPTGGRSDGEIEMAMQWTDTAATAARPL